VNYDQELVDRIVKAIDRLAAATERQTAVSAEIREFWAANNSRTEQQHDAAMRAYQRRVADIVRVILARDVPA
jgi:hypothetical protein